MAMMFGIRVVGYGLVAATAIITHDSTKRKTDELYQWAKDKLTSRYSDTDTDTTVVHHSNDADHSNDDDAPRPFSSHGQQTNELQQTLPHSVHVAAGKLEASLSESVEPTHGKVLITEGDEVVFEFFQKDEKGKEKETYPEKARHTRCKKDEKGKEKGAYRERRAGHTQCKYYSTPVGCKYGKYCKFLHGEKKTEIGSVELNFLDLPIRPGEKNCPYYMRTGGCKYASNCKYHHPDPTIVGQDSHSGYQSSGSPNPHVSGAPPLPSVSWPLQSSNETVPFYDSAPPHVAGMLLPPQGHYPNPQWNGYQAPAFPFTGQPSSLPMNNSTRTADGSGQFDEYPERPGQTECQHFIKTGYCKFKSACKFHHPKSRLSKASATAQSAGYVARSSSLDI